jgi:hypothetical protein
MVGVWAEDASAPSLIQAIRQRRTYAVTGDRIVVDFTLNDHPMGSELPPVRNRQLDVKVEAPDSIRMIELIRNGRVLERHFPEDTSPAVAAIPGTVKSRLRYGWGPWADLNLGRICDWKMKIQLKGGRFRDVVPCFQAGPFDESRRDRVRMIGPQAIQLESHTSRVKAFAEDPTKALVMEIEALKPDASLTLEIAEPISTSFTASLRQLQQDNLIQFTGGFTSESYLLERLVGPDHFKAEQRWNDSRLNSAGADFYYVRVLQHNNQMAWSSPIWVGKTG